MDVLAVGEVGCVTAGDGRDTDMDTDTAEDARVTDTAGDGRATREDVRFRPWGEGRSRLP